MSQGFKRGSNWRTKFQVANTEVANSKCQLEVPAQTWKQYSMHGCMVDLYWYWATSLKFAKNTDMNSTAPAAQDLLKALAVLSDTIVRRSAVKWEDLNPEWKSEKRPHFSRWSTILFFTSFSDFNNHRKATNRAVVFYM